MRENEGIRWLEQAEEDLKWAELLVHQGGYHIACFLAQQVAEKALKAVLYAQGKEIIIGHSIERLCTQATEYFPEFGERKSRWALLDAYYIPTRYPNGLPGSIPARVYDRETAQGAVGLAAEVVEFAKERIYGKERPI